MHEPRRFLREASVLTAASAANGISSVVILDDGGDVVVVVVGGGVYGIVVVGEVDDGGIVVVHGASTIGTIIITASASISAGMSGFGGGSGGSGLGSFAGIGGNGSGVNLVVDVNGASAGTRTGTGRGGGRSRAWSWHRPSENQRDGGVPVAAPRSSRGATVGVMVAPCASHAAMRRTSKICSGGNTSDGSTGGSTGGGSTGSRGGSTSSGSLVVERVGDVVIGPFLRVGTGNSTISGRCAVRLPWKTTSEDEVQDRRASGLWTAASRTFGGARRGGSVGGRGAS